MSQGYARKGMASSMPVSDHEPWQRPDEWLDFPVIPTDEQRIYMLVAVLNNGSNHFAFTCQGAYRVDWGDGNGWENVASNTSAEKNLAWADYAGNPTTAQGWRQALITVEPQDASNLTYFNLNDRHSALAVANNSGLLDLQISAPQLSTLWLSSSTVQVRHGWLQRVGIQGSTDLTTLQNAFRGLSGLVKIEGVEWTANVYDFVTCFYLCSSLLEIEFVTTSATATNFMFYGCQSLREVPEFDLSNCSSVANMFTNCSSLRSVPFFDLSLCNSTSNMFAGCNSLESVPLYDLSACTVTSSMFLNCYSLVSVPLFDLSSVTTAASMFQNCYSITTVPLFNLSNCTNTNNMFNSCLSLTEVPNFDLSASTNTSYMFNSCTSLTSLSLSLPATTSIIDFARSCTALRECHISDLGNVSTASTFAFASNSALESLTVGGLRYGINVASSQLQAAALDALYTSLGTAAGSQAIVVTNNPGTSGDTPTIATSKGWTVTGS